VNAAEKFEDTTALMTAALDGSACNAEIVRMLLNHKEIDVSLIQTGFQKTAFGLACFAGRVDVVKVFLNSGHNIILDLAQVLKDLVSKDKMLVFMTRAVAEGAIVNPDEVLLKYTVIRELLLDYKPTHGKKPPRKGKQTKPIKPPTELQIPLPSEDEQLLAEFIECLPAPDQVDQPEISHGSSSGKKKKAKTAEQRAQARISKRERKRQEEIEFRELEKSLDTLD